MLASDLRKKILVLAHESNEGHVASSFSIVEILIAIYNYSKLFKDNYCFQKRTILSKGHSVFAYYSLLHEIEVISNSDFQSICRYGSKFIGHVPYIPEIGLDYGSGSLGHGLPYSIGLAYGLANIGDRNPTFTIIGDGELNEGSCWESLLYLRKIKYIPLVVIIDNNLSSDRAIPMSDILDHFITSSVWNVKSVDGHNVEDIISVLEEWDRTEYLIIVANTTKGYPLPEMMNNPIWHHKSPDISKLKYFIEYLDSENTK